MFMLGLQKTYEETVMPHREYIRNGHLVSIEVTQDSRGRWYWSYTIDGAGFTAMLDQRLGSQDAAVNEAEHEANAKADGMPAGGSAK